MKTQRIRVSAVSYLNTLPFLYGINNSDVINDLELSMDIPSDCAKKILNDEVDLGLVPIAVLPQLKEYHIVSDYCIGADGNVDSVALFSDVPLNEIESIYLDYQSNTSVGLVKLLADRHWKITPKWLKADVGYEDLIGGTIAGVIIGDRTFNLSKNYQYKYDLSGEWKNLTGLPFVFACWVANKNLPLDFLQKFNNVLKHGVNNLDKVISAHSSETISTEALSRYLNHNISYMIDEKKEKAIEKFLSYIQEREVLNSEY